MNTPLSAVASSALLVIAASCSSAPQPAAIDVHYLGHASFLLTLDNGLTVLTDYGESMAYGLNSPVFELGDVVPDIVTLSHDHADHAGGTLPDGVGQLLTAGAGFEARGLTLTPISTYERTLDEPDNTSYLFEYGGVSVLHLGDCQGLITRIQEPGVADRVRGLYPGSYDLVLIPIGFTRDIVAEAAEFVKLLDARHVIPMHYWDPQDRDDFLDMLEDAADSRGRAYEVNRLAGPALEVRPHREGQAEATAAIGLTPAPVTTEAAMTSSGPTPR